MRRLLCRWFGHHWHSLGITRLDKENVVLWECQRCGDHQWREVWHI